MNDSKHVKVWRYVGGVLSVGLATAAGLLLDPVLQRHLPFVWFFAALVFTAWHGGFRPAVVATFLSVALAAFFFLPPVYSLEVEETEDGLALLVFFMAGVAIALYSRRLARLHEVVRQQVLERRIARDIQRGLLPEDALALAGFSMAGRSLPARDIGGDYFDFVPMPGEGETSLGIVIGDASGHGIGSALLMSETRAYLRAFALTCADVGQLLSLTNRRLADEIPSDCFVTLFLAQLEPRTNTLVWASAGHYPGYVIGPDGRVKTVLNSSGLPLGIDRTCEYPTSPRVSLSGGDLVLLFSDGLVEACSPGGLQFGVQRLLDVIRLRLHEPPAAIVDSVLHAVSVFSRPSAQLDDMTAVVLKVKSPSLNSTAREGGRASRPVIHEWPASPQLP
jgi:sigma-B regulation protein RsbU (phosphoserine phosphatase)